MDLNKAIWLVGSIKWKLIDKDNMEYEARITYSQMDALSYVFQMLKAKHERTQT